MPLRHIRTLHSSGAEMPPLFVVEWATQPNTALGMAHAVADSATTLPLHHMPSPLLGTA
jgi:hypothetical protein